MRTPAAVLIAAAIALIVLAVIFLYACSGDNPKPEPTHQYTTQYSVEEHTIPPNSTVEHTAIEQYLPATGGPRSL